MLFLLQPVISTEFYEWILVISLISIGLGYIFLYHAFTNPTTGVKTYIIRSIENKNDLMHTYLLPYILFIVPLIGIIALNNLQIIAIMLLCVLLCIIYMRSDLFSFDVILIVLGYNYYKITTDNNAFIAISKENLYEYINQELSFKLIDKNVLKYGE